MRNWIMQKPCIKPMIMVLSLTALSACGMMGKEEGRLIDIDGVKTAASEASASANTNSSQEPVLAKTTCRSPNLWERKVSIQTDNDLYQNNDRLDVRKAFARSRKHIKLDGELTTIKLFGMDEAGLASDKNQCVQHGLSTAHLVIKRPARTQDVKCESTANRPDQCKVEGLIEKVTLQKEFSRSLCQENSTWGSNNNYVWVKQGCRARFKVEYRMVAKRERLQYLQCGSSGQQSAQCKASGLIFDAEIEKRLSTADCRGGINWGYKDDQLWVDSSCQAKFKVKYLKPEDYQAYTSAWQRPLGYVDGKAGFCLPIPFSHQELFDGSEAIVEFGGTAKFRASDLVVFKPEDRGEDELRCGKKDSQSSECKVTNQVILDAVLGDQRSSANCEENKNWGFTPDGIWVNGGCQGDFDVYYQSLEEDDHELPILKANPENGAPLVRPDTLLQVSIDESSKTYKRFRQQLEKQRFTATINGNPIAAVYDAGKKTISIDHEPLQRCTNFEVTLAMKAESCSDNSNSDNASYSFSFTTGSALHEATHLSAHVKKSPVKVTEHGEVLVTVTDDYQLPATNATVKIASTSKNLVTYPLELGPAANGEGTITLIDRVKEAVPLTITSQDNEYSDPVDTQTERNSIEFISGPAFRISVQGQLSVDSGTVSTVTGSVYDMYNNLVDDGTNVHATATAGTISPADQQTRNGHFSLTFTPVVPPTQTVITIASGQATWQKALRPNPGGTPDGNPARRCLTEQDGFTKVKIYHPESSPNNEPIYDGTSSHQHFVDNDLGNVDALTFIPGAYLNGTDIYVTTDYFKTWINNPYDYFEIEYYDTEAQGASKGSLHMTIDGKPVDATCINDGTSNGFYVNISDVDGLLMHKTPEDNPSTRGGFWLSYATYRSVEYSLKHLRPSEIIDFVETDQNPAHIDMDKELAFVNRFDAGDVANLIGTAYKEAYQLKNRGIGDDDPLVDAVMDAAIGGLRVVGLPYTIDHDLSNLAPGREALFVDILAAIGFTATRLTGPGVAFSILWNGAVQTGGILQITVVQRGDPLYYFIGTICP